MRDIRVQMWVRNGTPTRFVLLINGVPVARQNTNGTPMQNGEWTVMLDERMGPDFKAKEV